MADEPTYGGPTAPLTIGPAKHAGFIVTQVSDSLGVATQPLFAGSLPACTAFIERHYTINPASTETPHGTDPQQADRVRDSDISRFLSRPFGTHPDD